MANPLKKETVPAPELQNFVQHELVRTTLEEKEPFTSKVKRIATSLIGEDLAMDLGTANTLIFCKGKGIVLNEPSVIAVKEDSREPLAVGARAKQMYGKGAPIVQCIKPLKGGVIADFEMTHLMIKDFLSRVSGKFLIRKPRIVISVPTGITMVEKRAVIDAAASCGSGNIRLIEEPMAAAIGAGLDVCEPAANMIVDIGGGTTEIAVITLGSTAYTESVRVAGDEMDEAIQGYLRKAFNLHVGLFEAERIKQAIGSAMPMSEGREVVAFGRDLANGVPRELVLDDVVIREALKEPCQAIVEAVFRALEKTSPELAEDIIRKGVHLAGGGTLLAGLPERLSLETGLCFYRAAGPLTAIVRGTGKILEDKGELEKVCIS